MTGVVRILFISAQTVAPVGPCVYQTLTASLSSMYQSGACLQQHRQWHLWVHVSTRHSQPVYHHSMYENGGCKRLVITNCVCNRRHSQTFWKIRTDRRKQKRTERYTTDRLTRMNTNPQNLNWTPNKLQRQQQREKSRGQPEKPTETVAVNLRGENKNKTQRLHVIVKIKPEPFISKQPTTPFFWFVLFPLVYMDLNTVQAIFNQPFYYFLSIVFGFFGSIFFFKTT